MLAKAVTPDPTDIANSQAQPAQAHRNIQFCTGGRAAETLHAGQGTRLFGNEQGHGFAHRHDVEGGYGVHITAPSCQGRNSLSPRPCSSLLLRWPDAVLS